MANYDIITQEEFNNFKILSVLNKMKKVKESSKKDKMMDKKLGLKEDSKKDKALDKRGYSPRGLKAIAGKAFGSKMFQKK